MCSVYMEFINTNIDTCNKLLKKWKYRSNKFDILQNEVINHSKEKEWHLAMDEWYVIERSQGNTMNSSYLCSNQTLSIK